MTYSLTFKIIISITVIIILLIITVLYKPKSNRYGIVTEHRSSNTYPDNDIVLQTIELYNRSGIQLPLDILEEIEQHNPPNLEQAIKLVEVHRTHWKYECMKKLLRP